MSDPTVSVLLPVYNGGDYLHAAMRSILDQTSGDFEVIAIDDGSKDESADIIRSYDDPRIRLHQQENHGLAWTLNRAVSLSRGRYLARQDQDDVALPERFARQVAYLDAHPDVYLLGTAAEIWEEDQRTDRTHRHPTDPLQLTFAQLFDNHFVHSSVMFRRALQDSVGLYSTEKQRQPEDFELWSRTARRHGIANLPDVLQVYREREGSMCRTGVHPYRDRVVGLCAENLAFACGTEEPSAAHQLAASLMHAVKSSTPTAAQLRAAQDVIREAARGTARQLNRDAAELDDAVESHCERIARIADRQTLRGTLSRVPRRVARTLRSWAGAGAGS